MIKTILVPVDFSKNSENALKYALMLAGRLRARLVLFHSYYSPHASGHLSANDTENGKRAGHEIAVRELTEMYNRLTPPAVQRVDYITSQQQLREALPGIIEENAVDLVVMGTQGIGWIEGKFFGTNASWTIENVNRPVIAIPENETSQQIKRIAYASEYLDSDIDNLQRVADLARLFEANIQIVHIEPPPATAEEHKLNTFKEHLKKKVDPSLFTFKSIVAKNVEHALKDYLKQYSVDLLVMSAQQRDLYDRWFGKSITRQMVHSLSKPVLFFHHKASERN
jgi:nucleotide-binding universal stress UspA family protein